MNINFTTCTIKFNAIISQQKWTVMLKCQSNLQSRKKKVIFYVVLNFKYLKLSFSISYLGKMNYGQQYNLKKQVIF